MRKKCKHTRLGNTSPKLTSKYFPQFDKANNGTWSKSQFRRGLSELEVKRRTTEWGTRVHEGWQSFSEHQVTQKILFEANTFFAPALRGLRHSSDNQKQEPKKYWLEDELACLLKACSIAVGTIVHSSIFISKMITVLLSQFSAWSPVAFSVFDSPLPVSLISDIPSWHRACLLSLLQLQR